MTATIHADPAATELMELAMKLPPNQRERLGNLLLDSLDVPDDTPDDVRESWRLEIRKRIADWQNGTVIPLDPDDVFQELDVKYDGSPK